MGSETAQTTSSVATPSKMSTGDSWWTLIHWDDLEHWMQDNHHIHSHYRQASYSYARSFASIFHLHNETINIWSHLIPAAISLPGAVALYTVLKPRYDKATFADVAAMSCFFLGATLCLGMSSIYHTLSNHSPRVCRAWNQLDYAGIACLIAGSFVPSVYYGFWCETGKQVLYWTMIGLLGMGCTVASVLPKFRTPAWRPVRAAMFVGMGISAVFPVLDGLSTYGLEQMRKQIGLVWLVLQGALYILGAGLYAIRWPERWAPGKFDMIGSSHQIFHLLVVLAALSHLVGLVKAFDYRHGSYTAACT